MPTIPLIRDISTVPGVRDMTLRKAALHLGVSIGVALCMVPSHATAQTEEPAQPGAGIEQGMYRFTDLAEITVQDISQVANQPPAADAAPPSTPPPTQANAQPSPANAQPNAAQQNPNPAPQPNANNNNNNNRNNANRNRASRSNNIARSSFSSRPTMMGDFFGGGLSILNGVERQQFNVGATGFILNGQPNGSANAFLGFQVNPGVLPDDAFSTGTGTDTNFNGRIDTFAILEPIPPSSAPTSPGPGFTFDGGTAVYADANGPFADGDAWQLNYSYSRPLANAALGGVVVAGPDVSTRRVKVSENFSPEVRNRIFTNYSFFNDTYGQLGDISRWILGTERVIMNNMASIELRLPMGATHSSDQDIGGGNNRAFELGNLTVIGKVVLLRDDHFTWSAGTGVTATLADDARLRQGNTNLLVIENQSVHLLPFTGLILQATDTTFLQGYCQLDVDTNGNPVFGSMAGGNLPFLGRFTDTTLLHLDAAVNQVVFSNSRSQGITSLLLNAELHYTTTTSGSDAIVGNGLTYQNLTNQFNILNATFGSHIVVGNKLVITPAMAIPLRDGLDEQFDYEAILQVNYLY